MADALQSVLTILENNWNDSNTDSITPNFIKITDKKRYDFNINSDVVFAQRSTNTIETAGVGDTNKHESENFNLDIRVIGADQESHWLNVIEEIKRILQANKINPNSDYQILEFDGQAQDLSDKTHNLWRYLLPVQIRRYNVNR